MVIYYYGSYYDSVVGKRVWEEYLKYYEERVLRTSFVLFVFLIFLSRENISRQNGKVIVNSVLWISIINDKLFMI